MLFYRFFCKDREKIIFNQIHKNRKDGSLRLRLIRQLSLYVCTNRSYCKRVSSYLSLVKGKVQASMAVEAALVMPLFIFSFMNLISIIEIYRLQSNLSVAMHQTAKEMAVYGYEYQEILGDGEAYKLESLGLSYLFAANKVKDILGVEYLQGAPISDGIDWYRSKVLEDGECIDLVATYQVSPMMSLMGFGRFPMCNRMRARVWTGYDVETGSSDIDLDELVYITPYGTVYHLSSYCTHIKLSIKEVDIERLSEYRNMDGKEYKECERCFDEYAVTFYITDYGELAHCSKTCSSLKRTIEVVPASEVGDRTVCIKCKTLYGTD